jgi:hypothetical protein
MSGVSSLPERRHHEVYCKFLTSIANLTTVKWDVTPFARVLAINDYEAGHAKRAQYVKNMYIYLTIQLQDDFRIPAAMVGGALIYDLA